MAQRSIQSFRAGEVSWHTKAWAPLTFQIVGSFGAIASGVSILCFGHRLEQFDGCEDSCRV